MGLHTGLKTILDDFSMTIEPSEVHALLGTNGTGKSTLAYLIMGCEGYMPSSGEIIFEGKTINTLKIHERSKLGITMAWQEPVRFEGIDKVKTRVALEDEAKAEVTGITEGNAEGARGHVDCMEIVKDNSVAKAIPIVNVS
jgi:Fe-S cluster assembly ATPase SufC